MPTVTLDKIDGAQASHHIINGWAITRKATVSGLSPSSASGGPGEWSTGLLFQEAENALIAVVGNRGSPCPNLYVETYLEQFVPRARSDSVVDFDIIYKGYPAYQVDIRGALSQTASNKDANGNLITVQYTYPANYPNAAGYAGRTDTQGCFVQRDLRDDTFTLRFPLTAGEIGGEPVSALDLLSYFIAAYEGTINAQYYEIGYVLGAPHQWMITSISGTTRDGGFTYDVAWTFELRAIGWDKFVVFVDPNTGKPPPDVVDGTGDKTVQVQTAVLFPSFSFSGN